MTRNEAIRKIVFRILLDAALVIAMVICSHVWAWLFRADVAETMAIAALCVAVSRRGS